MYFICMCEGVDSSSWSHAIACTVEERKSSRQPWPVRYVKQLLAVGD